MAQKIRPLNKTSVLGIVLADGTFLDDWMDSVETRMADYRELRRQYEEATKRHADLQRVVLEVQTKLNDKNLANERINIDLSRISSSYNRTSYTVQEVLQIIAGTATNNAPY